MVQIAILIVLILIAILLAPWLLGVLAAAVAVYGLYLVIAAAGFAVVVVAASIWFIFAGRRKDNVVEIHGERKVCTSCQVEIPANARRCSNCGVAT